MTNIEILMKDGCTRAEAENHLNNGAVIFDEKDLTEHFETYMEEWGIDDDEKESYKDMIHNKKPLPDWGAVEIRGESYYIMYVL